MIPEHGTRAGVHGFEATAALRDHTIGPMPDDLRNALAGVRAFVLDARGRLVWGVQCAATDPAAERIWRALEAEASR